MPTTKSDRELKFCAEIRLAGGYSLISVIPPTKYIIEGNQQNTKLSFFGILYIFTETSVPDLIVPHLQDPPSAISVPICQTSVVQDMVS